MQDWCKYIQNVFLADFYGKCQSDDVAKNNMCSVFDNIFHFRCFVIAHKLNFEFTSQTQQTTHASSFLFPERTESRRKSSPLFARTRSFYHQPLSAIVTNTKQSAHTLNVTKQSAQKVINVKNTKKSTQVINVPITNQSTQNINVTNTKQSAQVTNTKQNAQVSNVTNTKRAHKSLM